MAETKVSPTRVAGPATGLLAGPACRLPSLGLLPFATKATNDLAGESQRPLLFLIMISFGAASGRQQMEDIEAFVTGQLASWEVPGCAVAAVSGGAVVLAAGFGHRDLAAGLPVTAETLFAIGSTTKA